MRVLWANETLSIRFIFQAIINSTVTPNMTFTKTSQKFGQWSDLRANTIYGLGFNSEFELNKVRLVFSMTPISFVAPFLINANEFGSS